MDFIFHLIRQNTNRLQIDFFQIFSKTNNYLFLLSSLKDKELEEPYFKGNSSSSQNWA